MSKRNRVLLKEKIQLRHACRGRTHDFRANVGQKWPPLI